MAHAGSFIRVKGHHVIGPNSSQPIHCACGEIFYGKTVANAVSFHRDHKLEIQEAADAEVNQSNI